MFSVGRREVSRWQLQRAVETLTGFGAVVTQKQVHRMNEFLSVRQTKIKHKLHTDVLEDLLISSKVTGHRINATQFASVCNESELRSDYNALSRIAASFRFSAQKYRNYVPLLKLIFITFHHLQNSCQRELIKDRSPYTLFRIVGCITSSKKEGEAKISLTSLSQAQFLVG